MRRGLRAITLGLLVVMLPTFGLSLPKLLQGGQANAAAATFQAGHIIDDNIFTDSNSLTAAQIQTFLNDMVGSCYAPGSKSTSPENGACINQFVENPTTLQNNFSNPSVAVPGGISAAQIIYNAGQQYSINPEVLLTTLEKEQGLTTDTWPWYSEYQKAMGYSCPDTSPCNGSYADFYKQVTGAAWQFRQYLNNPGSYNYWLGSNTIDYAPGCGGSTVNIVNAATAALYIYTPYQPDSNVLAKTNPIGSSSGPGGSVSGDSCAAYGNRNFWWYFNTWFGPSVDTNVSLIEESGTSTYYVEYSGQKQGVPSQDVLDAWGLNGLPVYVLDSSVFNSIPTASTNLARYAANSDSGKNYFADNGNDYYVSSNDASIWNFASQPSSHVTSVLVNFADYQGELQPFAATSGSSTIYAVDAGILHGLTSGTNYELWGGPNATATTLSSSFFNTLTRSSTISNPEFTYNGTTYALSDKQAFSLSANTLPLLPSSWTPLAIHQGLFNTFTNSGALQYMIKDTSSTIYLLDNGTKRGIPSAQLYNAYQATATGSMLDTSTVSAAFLSSLPGGTNVTSNLVSNGGSYYVVYNGLHQLSSTLVTAYNAVTNAMAIQSPYTSLIPVVSAATRFVGTPGSPAVYFVDAGTKLPFANTSIYTLAGGGGVTELVGTVLSQLTSGSIMSDYVTDGTTNYLLNQTDRFTTPSGVATAWGLTNPVTLSPDAINAFSSAGNLAQRIQIPDGHFCLVDSKTYYCANDSPTLSVWELNVGAVKPSQTLIDYQLTKGQPLSRFVMGKAGQSYATTVFTAADGSLFGIRTSDNAANLGFSGTTIRLDQATIVNLLSAQPWQGYLAEDDSGNIWVLDNGTKHSLPTAYSTAWVGSQTPSVLGTAYLNSLPTASSISNSIKASNGATVYGIKNGERFGMPSPQIYANSGLAAYSTVSAALVNSIPSGGVWSN